MFDFLGSRPDIALLPNEALEDVFGDQPVACSSCDESIAGEYVEIGEDLVCKDCANARADEVWEEAKSEAMEVCQITRPLPTFDPFTRWAPTPEEYANGDKEANTENAYRCRCRHKHTNYDALIERLDRYGTFDQLRYAAIHSRIVQLVDDEIESRDLIRPDFEDEAEWQSETPSV